MVGVIYGRPPAERTHPHELQDLAAVPVRLAVAALPGGMVSRTVAAGTFAAFLHRGPVRELEETVRGIYRLWLPRSAQVLPPRSGTAPGSASSLFPNVSATGSHRFVSRSY